MTESSLVILSQQSNNVEPKPQTFFTLPLRDLVVYPHMTTTILVGREKSVKSVEEAKRLGLPIFVVTQVSAENDDFEQKNLHQTGMLCGVIESVRTPDGTLKIIIQGLMRAKLKEIVANEKFHTCYIDLLSEEKVDTSDNKELLGLIKACVDNFNKYGEFNKRVTAEIIASVGKIKSPYEIAYLMATYVSGPLASKQYILEEDSLLKKLYKVLEMLVSEIEIGRTEAKISKNIQEKVAKSQKDFYLNEQLKNIKKELGQDEDNDHTKELKSKLSKIVLPKEVAEKCKIEMSRLEKMNPYSAESGVVRNYLEWVVDLPWSDKTKPNKSLSYAQKVLDRDHYGLEKVKERILEFIAVQIKNENLRGPILCLVGAPGVGKTSLAKSIAEALKRKFVKVSLGGVRDESEIRGHRRTYIGAMPGRIIQSMRKAKVTNPLILLDEIDKMSHDFRGDPASALLEVLDPEQNNSFSDHYLEVDYDLSKAMFVATANSLATIPVPLRDRMEIIRIAGYTENEKLHIAKEHLLSKQRKENGLTNSELSITDEAILHLIRTYTFEAGVRNLNREMSNLGRKAAKEIVTKKVKTLEINKKNLTKYAGIEKFKYGIAKEKDMVGVVTGLAYTEYGGDLLDIEVLKFEGSGKIQTTGKLGDVMKESASAALSYSRSLAKKLKINAKQFNKYDFHIHVPEGATPKDGPSAGVAICVALVSSLANIPVKRDIAMTGEITLSGRVLKIGGLKEKLLAAVRGHIKEVLIPEDNRKDLEEMPKEVLKQLKIIPISHVDEAIKIAIRKK